VDVSAGRLWVVSFSSGDSGSPPLVQIVTCVACRLFFITSKNAELKVMAILKNSIL